MIRRKALNKLLLYLSLLILMSFVLLPNLVVIE